jgi:hypothetical protein
MKYVLYNFLINLQSKLCVMIIEPFHKENRSNRTI